MHPRGAAGAGILSSQLGPQAQLGNKLEKLVDKGVEADRSKLTTGNQTMSICKTTANIGAEPAQQWPVRMPQLHAGVRPSATKAQRK
jgi:hypothetical protein